MKRIFYTAALPCMRLFATLATMLLTTTAGAIDVQRDDVQDFITELTADGNFDADEVSAILGRSTVQQNILDAMSRPAERVKPWHEYRAIFITPERIAAGVKFYEEHRASLERIEADTGVPPEMILGIIGVESYYGRITGKHKVVDALVTLGFDYPPRAKFFRSELNEAFQLSREEEFDIETLVGSYAGAMGPPQFIPSSYRAYAVDGDGDGVRDLLNNWEDILASVANYFAVHKWRAGNPVAERGTPATEAGPLPTTKGLKPDSTVGGLTEAGVVFPTELAADAKAGLWELEGENGPQYWVGFHNLYVITRYNRSIMYALATWELGNAVVLAADGAEETET
jgi:membrane-bound lytic murein transglycosylase B